MADAQVLDRLSAMEGRLVSLESWIGPRADPRAVNSLQPNGSELPIASEPCPPPQNADGDFGAAKGDL